MEFMIIDYKDPLFSIFVLGLVIVVVSFANRWFETFKNKSETRKISKFVKNFNLGAKTGQYKKILEGGVEAAQTLALSATTRSKSGEHEEAIKIYLALLDILSEKESKTEIMTMLGKTYYKAGFMQRSKEILLEALKLKPRDKEALKLLLIIYESLKNYSKALEVVDTLEEMDADVADERGVLEILKIINDPAKTHEKKSAQLAEYYSHSPKYFRQIYEFLSVFDVKKFWDYLKEEEIAESMDILWNMRKEDLDMEKVSASARLKEIYTAKGYINEADSSDIFELNVLINLKEKKEIAGLSFEYSCDECGNSFPMHFNRCPSCRKILTRSLDINLEEAKQESEFSSAGFF